MPVVSQVAFLRPRPGKLDAFMADVARARKIIASCGGKVRVWNQLVGPETGSTAVVVECRTVQNPAPRRDCDLKLATHS